MTVGLISDTHGLLRPEAVEALQGVDFILHAGDVGKDHILPELEKIAPVTVVKGNIDKAAFAAEYPMYEIIELGGVFFYMIHILQDMDIDPEGAGMHVVVSGHSHRPSIKKHHGVLYVNPGSAGPQRFSLPITVAKIEIEDQQVEAEIIEICK
jgi:putative phosphoesterase